MEEQTIQGFPLSPPQVHLWRLKEACAFPWNVGLRAALEGPLAPAALEAALRAVVSDEEILRTGFAHLSGSAVGVQVIGEEPLFELQTETLSEPAGEAREAALEARFEALLARDFALESQPPSPALRVALFALGDDRHELQLVQPALVSDVASLELLLRRLAEALAGADATAAGAPSDEDQDERMQYADLAEWLLEMFEGEEAPEGLGFWRRVDLEAVRTTRLSLETDSGEAFRPERVAVPLSPETLEALAAPSGGEDGSRADRILAAWQHLIARHTEREDACVAVASPGRAFEGLEEALGPFQRSLPLALAASEEDTLQALAARAASAREEAAEWHELWELERARSGAEPAFLPYVFEHFAAEPALRSGALALRVVERRGFCDRFRLKLVLDEAAAVPLTLWHDAAVLEGEAARLFAEQLATLLADACRRPATPLAELSPTSDAERERLLTVLGHGAPSVTLPDVLPFPLQGALAHDAILAHAARTPEACAVLCADGELSYGELVLRAGRLARHLSALGVARGERVGIAMGRSREWPVAMLACLFSGAAYLPLPPGYPAERVGFMLADSGARVVLTRRADAATSDSLAASDKNLQVVVVDELDLDDASGDGAVPASPATESDPAYVIYTSGSTGKPKGVPIPHGHLARSTAARFAHYDRAPGRYLLLSSFAFDSSIVGVFWTLCAGGTLVLPAEGEETDLVALAGWIERARVTHTLALPSLWAVLLEETPAERLRSLELVLVAGEACTRELVGRHLKKLPDCQLHNEYGPTEATVWCTAHDCRIASRRALVPIGRPIPGASAYVVDAALELLPRGLAGELVVGGPCVAPGYLGRPELTAERFLPDRFGPDSDGAARIYRTGDLVRMLVDGTLEFLGRVDHQVKIRGFRVELGEIESVLAAAPGVQDVLVHARDDRSGNKELVAYVVRTTGDRPDAEELRQRLAGPLPAYMIPAHFVFLEELPRLPNGKIDRAKLPDPSQDDAAHAPYAAPRSPLELVLAELWADVLDLERVGLDDDFFLLGGHSIVATQLFARITDALEVRIALRTLFEARTVRRLADEILADAAARPRIERAAELLAEALASDEEEPG